jgi:hypothetical protein
MFSVLAAMVIVATKTAEQPHPSAQLFCQIFFFVF